MSTQISKRSQAKFEYFAQCLDVRRLPEIPYAADGHSAAECFHAKETHGIDLPCKEPQLLARSLNGKEQHGITVSMLAQDYLDRLFFAKELVNYPRWVQREILSLAAKLAEEQIGFVPTFVETGKDFTV